MSKPVRTNPFADEEIFTHIRYYAARSVNLGAQLWDEVQTTFKLISEYPSIGEVVPRARVQPDEFRCGASRFSSSIGITTTTSK